MAGAQERIALVDEIIYELRYNKPLREEFLKTLNDTEEHKEVSTWSVDPMYMTKPNGSL